jgi:hypothetical protein
VKNIDEDAFLNVIKRFSKSDVNKNSILTNLACGQNMDAHLRPITVLRVRL